MACEDGAVQPGRACQAQLNCVESRLQPHVCWLPSSCHPGQAYHGGVQGQPTCQLRTTRCTPTHTAGPSLWQAQAATIQRLHARLLGLKPAQVCSNSPPTCQVRTTSSTLYCWSSRRRNTSLSSAAGRWAQPCGSQEQAGVWVVPGSPHGAATGGSVRAA